MPTSISFILVFKYQDCSNLKVFIAFCPPRVLTLIQHLIAWITPDFDFWWQQNHLRTNYARNKAAETAMAVHPRKHMRISVTGANGRRMDRLLEIQSVAFPFLFLLYWLVQFLWFFLFSLPAHITIRNAGGYYPALRDKLF